MTKLTSSRPFFEGLSEKARAKLEAGFQKAKSDPLAQQMVDNLNRASLKSAQDQQKAGRKTKR